MVRLHRLAVRFGMTGATAATILFMPDDQFKALVASLVSGALSSIVGSVVSNWVYTLFGIPTGGIV